jgi:phosphoribosylaminoimidazolecarboxamide formyltransferase/IMP cyclohydrolase
VGGAIGTLVREGCSGAYYRRYFSSPEEETAMADAPDKEVSISGKLSITCKYGENGYMVPAALYDSEVDDPLSLARFKVLAGTDPSYNNLCDLDRLLQTITHAAASFEVNRGRVPWLVVGVKHGNACGAAFNFNDQVKAASNAAEGDPLALFGGLVVTNFPVTEAVAEALITHGMPDGGRRILDGIVAPSVDEAAMGLFKRKGDKCRLLVNPALAKIGKGSLDTAKRVRYVRGGLLAQPNYTFVPDLKSAELTKNADASEAQENDMLLAKAIGDTSNSNTITLVKDGKLIANGVGQQARVRGANLAVNLAGYSDHDINGASASSDSFFPFTDGPEVLADAGVKAILSTSGSVKDAEVSEFLKERGIAYYLIPDASSGIN